MMFCKGDKFNAVYIFIRHSRVRLSFRASTVSSCIKSRICHTNEKTLQNDIFCYYRKRAGHLIHCKLCFEKCFQDDGKTARLEYT